MEPISLDEGDSIRNISGPGYIPPAEEIKTDQKIQTGKSSIKESEYVVIPYIPSMEFPLLFPPSREMGGDLTVVNAKDASGVPFTFLVMKVHKEVSEVETGVLKSGVNNLREIEEEVRTLIRSPEFQRRIEGIKKSSQAPAVGKIGKSTAPTSQTPSVASLDRTHVLDRIPQPGEVPSLPPAASPTQTPSVIPLVASVLIGGALSIGIVESTTNLAGVSSNPLVDVVDFTKELQPIFASVIAPQDIVPLINLMIAAPIYYHSWNEAVGGGVNQKDQKKMTEMAKKFAEDVIRMVSDPSVVLKHVYGMKGADQFSLTEKEELANLLRFVMLGTALGLLYAVEVGKVQRGEYRGIMAEEVRDLLFGDLAKPVETEKGKKTSKQERPRTPVEQLSLNLAKYASDQLSFLPPADRVKAANILLDYMEERREVEHMLDPLKVFRDFYSAFTFKNPASSNH
jgi:hypothetical protein